MKNVTLKLLKNLGKKKKLLTLIRRRNLLGNTLKEFLLDSEGGDSLFMFSYLCSLNKNDIITYVIPNPQDYHKSYVLQCDVIFKIPSSRVLNKPLLISSFRAQDYFHTSSEVSVLGIPKTFKEGNRRHSMNYMRARISAKGEYFLPSAELVARQTIY